jgi:small-conductance mechanosensitive channel
MRPTRVITICILTLAVQGPARNGEDDEPGPAGTFFRVEKINPSLDGLDEQINLSTPQACMEHFVVSARKGRWRSAARALNFRLIGPVNEDQAARQARRLYYLINQKAWIDWSLLPDRPDGVQDNSSLSAGSGSVGKPRRSIRLDSIKLDGRDIPISVQRVKAPDAEPIWLISAQTVENIDRLYDAHGPSWLARQAPDWSRRRILWRVPLWQWLAMVILVALGILVAWLVIKVASRGLVTHLGPAGGQFVQAVKWPAAILIAGLASYSSIGSLLTLPGPVSTFGSPLVLTLIVISATWLAVRVLGFFSEQFAGRVAGGEDLEDPDGALVRLTVFRYVLIILVVAVGLSVLLLSIDMFRTLGIALLGSAGAAAVVLGIAGHAVLGNLIAGVQIALARPFRIGDTVIVEGFWGKIEELRYTYVAVRTWDEKRVIFPVKYFLDHWFENWSKTDPYLIKPIYLNVDYRADVQAIREAFLDIVKQEPDWAEDRDEPDVLVVECGEETITVRLTCGGADPSTAWSLVNRVREKLVAWLQQFEGGRYLPRQRVVLYDRQQDAESQQDREDRQPEPSTSGEHEGAEGGGDE